MTLSAASEKLQKLTALFGSLPSHLPTKTDCHISSLDPEEIEDLGYSGALNQCFHRVWGYKANGLSITERGAKLTNTILILQHVLKHERSTTLIENWIDALIVAAEQAGADTQ